MFEIRKTRGWGTHEIIADITINTLCTLNVLFKQCGKRFDPLANMSLMFDDSTFVYNVVHIHTISAKFVNRDSTSCQEKNIRVVIEVTI